MPPSHQGLNVPPLFGLCWILALLASAFILPGVTALQDNRHLENIFAHTSTKAKTEKLKLQIQNTAETRQNLGVIGNREESNTTGNKETLVGKDDDELIVSNTTMESDNATMPATDSPGEAENRTPSPTVETLFSIAPSQSPIATTANETDSPSTSEPSLVVLETTVPTSPIGNTGSNNTDGETNSTTAEATSIAPNDGLSVQGNTTTSTNASTANNYTTNDNETATWTSPTATPTVAPTGERATVLITVHSSFILTTQQSNWTDQPETIEWIDGLTQAFSNLAGSVVQNVNARVVVVADPNGTEAMAKSTRHYQQRRLGDQRERWEKPRQLQTASLNATVDYDPASAVLSDLRPASPCPETSEAPVGTVCVTAFGEYKVEVVESEHAQSVYNTLVTETQVAIDRGELQGLLMQADPDSIFVVQGASEPVTKPPPSEVSPATGTEAPENAQEGGETSGKEDDSVMLGLMIAIGVTAFIVAILLAIFSYLQRSTPPPPPHFDDKDTEEADEGEVDKDLENEDPPSVAPVERYPHDQDDDDESDGPSMTYIGVEFSDRREEEQDIEYKRRVERLVSEQCPEESENVEKLMEQFRGRLLALIAMLENMDEVERQLEKDQGHDLDDYSDEEERRKENQPLEQRTAPFGCEEETKEEVQELEPGVDRVNQRIVERL